MLVQSFVSVYHGLFHSGIYSPTSKSWQLLLTEDWCGHGQRGFVKYMAGSGGEDIEGQLQGNREGNHRNSQVYHPVAELLALQGYERTTDQCRNKLKVARLFHLFRGGAFVTLHQV